MAESTPSDFFGSLEIVKDDEPLPTITRGRGATERVTAFDAPLLDSIKHNSPFTTWIPPVGPDGKTDMIAAARNIVNSAAKANNVGVRIVVDLVRNDNGELVKDKDGKAQYLVQQRGAHKGTVRFRLQGSPERRKAKPRAYNIVNDPDNKDQKAVRRVSDKTIVARGTHDEMRAELKRLKETPTA